MTEEGFLARSASEVLSAIAASGAVDIVPSQRFGERARLELVGAKSVRYAYLDSDAGARLSLRIYPGDTLTQAKHLYRDPSRVAALLDLRANGWNVAPNFHFGFMERGLTWTTSRLDVESYFAYWTERIERVGAVRKDDWETYLRGLIDDGIFDPNDEPKFDADFRATKRTVATPRPGLVARRSWPLTQTLDAGFPQSVGSALRDALVALREPLTTLEDRTL